MILAAIYFTASLPRPIVTVMVITKNANCDTNFFVCLLLRRYRIDALVTAAGLVRTTLRFRERLECLEYLIL
jgi:hypothetical protein